jgi:TolA-binding protein
VINKLTAALFLIFLFILSGCLQTRSDVKTGEQGRVLQQQVSTLQKSTADVNSRFEEIEEQIRFINGKSEVLENQLAQSKQENEQIKKISIEQNQANTQKLAILQEALLKMEQEQEKLRAEMVAVKNAFKDELIKSAPAPESTKNSFENAEQFFAKKDFRNAILEYQKYREKNPKGKNFSTATYKMGICFQELGMKEDAKAFYEEVISKFPKSDEAKKSRIRLQKLK